MELAIAMLVAYIPFVYWVVEEAIRQTKEDRKTH
jgi:hypothetical protein